MFVKTSNNEIIDLSYCRYFEEEHRYWNGADCYSFEESEIVKKADTIEELCDKFVYIKYIDDKTFHYFYNNINTTKNELYDNEGILHYKPRKELEIYGAIWTKKGLIYVAKVNEKGELEMFKEELE